MHGLERHDLRADRVNEVFAVVHARFRRAPLLALDVCDLGAVQCSSAMRFREWHLPVKSLDTFDVIEVRIAADNL
jgi:hypothetical protein